MVEPPKTRPDSGGSATIVQVDIDFAKTVSGRKSGVQDCQCEGSPAHRLAPLINTLEFSFD